MPYCSHAARVPPTVGTVFLVVGLALSCMAHPARADEAPAKSKPDTTVRIKAFPPSIQVDAPDAKGDKEDAKHDGRHGDTHIHIDGDNQDLDFDTFSSQVQKMPWVIGLVFLVVGSIFLTPVVLLIGIIWYKLRKTRLQNEAMLALAAKGVVPPSQAAEALATGAAPATAAPQVYQQALALRRRVVWSDLRKGIILAAIGAAFVLYAMTENGEASWVGLVLLFVGAGYLVLWWLEGRHLAKSAASSAGNGNGAGPGSSGG
jgi:hypothetical protein